MADTETESSFVYVHARISSVIREAMKAYVQAQKGLRFRSYSMNQMVVDAVIEKLEREGFMPTLVFPTEVIPDEDPDFEQYAPSDPGSTDASRPWDNKG